MRRNIAVLVTYILVFMGDARGHAQTDASRPSTRNEIGLQIGATETPSIGLAGGGDIHLNSSLALGAEYDRQLSATARRSMEESTSSPLPSM
jgi:hypothetical protein